MSVKNYPNVAAMQRTGKATGGRVKKQRGSSVERMGSGRPIQWQTGAVGQRRKRDYMDYVAPGAARRQLAKQQPGRRAASIGPGGWSTGGKVAKATGGRVKKQGGGQAHREWFEQQTSGWTPAQRATNRARTQQIKRGLTAKRQLKKAPPGGRISVRGPGMKTGGKVAKATGGRVKKLFGGRQKMPPAQSLPKGWRPPSGPTRPTRIKLTPAQIRTRAAQRSLRRSPPPKRLGATGPGYKKGGRATRAKGGKAKR